MFIVYPGDWNMAMAVYERIIGMYLNAIAIGYFHGFNSVVLVALLSLWAVAPLICAGSVMIMDA